MDWLATHVLRCVRHKLLLASASLTCGCSCAARLPRAPVRLPALVSSLRHGYHLPFAQPFVSGGQTQEARTIADAGIVSGRHKVRCR